VNKRFVWHLETSNVLTNEQCGFRRNHSTLDTLSSLNNDICNAKNQKQHLILIALDLEKAYDTVWQNRALKAPGANAILYTKIRSTGIGILYCRINQI